MPADGMGAATKSNQGRLRHFPLTARARQTYTFPRASAIATMSALGQTATSVPLFNDFVGNRKERLRNFRAKRFRGLEINR
jgi:hypothetical protein